MVDIDSVEIYTVQQRSRITSWIREQAVESSSVDAESLVTKIVETPAVTLPELPLPRRNPTNPKRLGLSKPIYKPAQHGIFKPAQLSKVKEAWQKYNFQFMAKPNLLSYTLPLADSCLIRNVSQQESSELVSTCQFPVYNDYKLYY